MSEKTVVKLITGEFDASDAREILLTLIDRKIQFHELKNFSEEIRFGEGGKAMKIRLEQLKADKLKIVELIETAKKDNKQISIYSDIQINFV